MSESVRDITLREAMDEYIAMKRNILSPATIREYLALQKYSYGNLLDHQPRCATLGERICYRGTIDDYSLKFQQIVIAHFEGMQHEIQHGEAKT